MVEMIVDLARRRLVAVGRKKMAGSRVRWGWGVDGERERVGMAMWLVGLDTRVG